MTAQELLDSLLHLKEVYGTLNVPVSVYLGGERYEITMTDDFTNEKDGNQELYHIDLNAKYYYEEL